MLYEIMAYCHNFFPQAEKAEHGTYVIEGGMVSLSNVQDGQYFTIDGSVFNSGIVYQKKDGVVIPAMTDETFTGWIIPLALPAEFVSLAAEIEEWQETNGSLTAAPYQSESFGGYSYTKASSSSGGAYGWKDAFASRLKTWRKI